MSFDHVQIQTQPTHLSLQLSPEQGFAESHIDDRYWHSSDFVSDHTGFPFTKIELASPLQTSASNQEAEGAASFGSSQQDRSNPHHSPASSPFPSRSSSSQGFEHTSVARIANPDASHDEDANQKTCTNCFTQITPLWRRNHVLGNPLCNSCWLFFKIHGISRPLSLKADVVRKTNRGSGASSLGKSNGAEAGPWQEYMLAVQATPTVHSHFLTEKPWIWILMSHPSIMAESRIGIFLDEAAITAAFRREMGHEDPNPWFFRSRNDCGRSPRFVGCA